ncbi:efflux RND transporter periplasmic adaptor subunit [Polaribacter dokdonensis]|uniref:Multidrug efflux pump subunit AcrA (Membrane-fusion protein) n=1 Tax=Polaribacter dokdonensis DSW-5 TaxID=1300348 RepID=A0A0M9CIH1_9FLAO|nr:HlyD family secretion protein [Polaribacter dokdonensis]KOY53173.1 Secretion protein HlyD [Polaribacter dokdonensis DSW-5]SEE58103.1 Multidrug efflux pump subunit AcrA (membrane-fusion protein) [Polaribacter dokdonensis DSW-5]
MSKKKIAIISVISLISIYLIYSYFSPSSDGEVYLTTEVKKGNFVSEVITSGEAQSTSLKKINGPENLRKFKLRDIKIQDLVPEGSIVKVGDYVARLDPTGVNEQIIDARLNLETAQSKYTQQQLDTTLSLKQERNAIKDLSFSMEQTRLELKQSIYEPPATIKKLEIDLEKSERDLREKEENYRIKKRQANAKMVEVGTEVSKIRKELNDLLELLKSFTIYSDGNGMITYFKNWDGSKKKVGSTISPWNPTVASLPDLTKMESKTYANEVDIRKIKKGLPVKVGFDAFPDVEIPGIVTDVANVGENKRGSDIKVFQVMIKLNESNDNIRPGMTTSNKILTFEKKDVLSIPLEAIFSKDSITYVYKKSGFSVVKKEVKIGDSNNDSVIITEGLSENDVVYLNKPEGYENDQIAQIN